MKLTNLVARVAREFSARDRQQLRMVQKVKDGLVRDVVTELDMRLHDISNQFVAERLPRCKLLSEEGTGRPVDIAEIGKGEWLVVDPLDGSNNFAVGMPNYGYMATYLNDGRIVSAVVVLPESGQYILVDGEDVIYAQPLPLALVESHGSVYYAYPPTQVAAARQARRELVDLIDEHSAGMYRYGSSCVGMYNLLCGKHQAFIGHGIRLWDALAFLPILASRGFSIQYTIQSDTITVLAGMSVNFLKSAQQILEVHQRLEFIEFQGGQLRIND